MKLFFAVLAALATAALGEKTTYSLAPFTGNGSCSQFPVDSISYSVVSDPTPLAAVFACNKVAYDALLPANLSDPATASLPPPLIELSCVNRNNVVCEHTFPTNRKLKPQIMCVLLKNWGAMPVNATLDVTWTPAALNNSQNTTAPPPQKTGSGAGRTVATASALVSAVLGIAVILL